MGIEDAFISKSSVSHLVVETFCRWRVCVGRCHQCTKLGTCAAEHMSCKIYDSMSPPWAVSDGR